MIRYREYWPAFFDRDDKPEEGEVETLDDLIEVPFIKERAAKHGGDIKYAISANEDHGHLMRESKKDEWWVVATLWGEITPTEKVPLWVAPERKLTKPFRFDDLFEEVIPLDDLFASGAVKKTVR